MRSITTIALLAAILLLQAPAFQASSSASSRRFLRASERGLLSDETENGTELAETDANFGVNITEIEGLFGVWNNALKTENPDTVLAQYADNAVLLATLANPPLDTPAKIRGYFVSFLKKKPTGVINEQHVRILNPTTAINSGVYTFSFAADNSTATARFTYVYRKIGGGWKIGYHHSSLLPEAGVGIKSQLQGQIEAAFRDWNAALGTGKPEVVADLYTADALLLPTVSNWVRVGRDAIIDYFETFLAKGPYGKIVEGAVHDLGENAASYTGIYTFTFKDGSAVNARFSYTYVRVGDKWLITDHHSSALPAPWI